MLRNIVFVIIGGAVGAALRYLTGLLLTPCRVMSLPVATLAVNVAGCFVLGLLLGWVSRNAAVPQPVVLMLTTGICGALTTFSTFTSEAYALMEGGRLLAGGAYMLLSLALGFAVFALGMHIMK